MKYINENIKIPYSNLQRHDYIRTYIHTELSKEIILNILIISQ